MRLESFDTGKPAVHVKLDELEGWKILGRLSSLIMVGCDCGMRSITIEPPGNLAPGVRRAMERLIARNPVVAISGRKQESGPRNEFGYVVLERGSVFLCLRDYSNEKMYSFYMAALEENVDLASRCAYLIADILGFTSFLAFEVRFGVYELLNNVFEHSVDGNPQHWVKLTLERKGDILTVSIVDKGIEFDPTGNDQFNLRSYLSSGNRRGLGLILTRKITEQMHYKRELGYNKVFFEKSISSRDSNKHSAKGEEMAQLIVGEPALMQDGSYRITLEGDLDTKGALIMEDLLNQLLEQKMFRVLLDFEKVPFVSSAGVGILLGMVSSLRDEGGEVYFLNISPKVKSVFSLLNLDDFFRIVDSEKSIVEF